MRPSFLAPIARVLAFSALLGAPALASTASAASPGPAPAFVGAGFAWRVNGMQGNDYWTSGLGGAAGFTLLRSPNADWAMQVEYGELAFDHGSFEHYIKRSSGATSGAPARFAVASLALRLHPARARLQPYLDLGLGFERTWMPQIRFTTPSGPSTLGASRRTHPTAVAGVGVSYRATRGPGVFAELHATRIGMPGDPAYPANARCGVLLP